MLQTAVTNSLDYARAPVHVHDLLCAFRISKSHSTAYKERNDSTKDQFLSIDLGCNILFFAFDNIGFIIISL